MTDVGVVAIGRNEGERLKRCLTSAVACTDRVVYVDSGSTDDSVEFAESIGVEVVDLDTSIPFTAARARNAGIKRLTQKWDGLAYVQVLDGDCEIRDGWVQFAYAFLESNPQAAVVCGRRRERHPEQTIYNHLCDLEWETPIGKARSCGGDALFRLTSFDQVGGYNPSVIAGEEPELCVRLRGEGFEVHRIDHEMTWHDAAMTTLAQYWKRAKRAGHAYAQGAHMHGKPPERHNVKQTRSAIVWGLLLPLGALLLAFFTYGLSLLAYLMLVLLQAWRIRRNELRRGRTPRDASLLARYIMIAKFAQAQGVLLFHWRRLTGKQATLIEYKGAAQGGATHG
ncbi:MAG: glycosyl transferase [Phycisphaerae bacterium]|nr:glycosyl transferase [Phycisphaerae bacterium]MBM91464.1 glycosyl transferase [Phycisphaerae bacterium]MBM92667.1 glycosyl transferase [Phycisphaerae bacterium]